VYRVGKCGVEICLVGRDFYLEISRHFFRTACGDEVSRVRVRDTGVYSVRAARNFANQRVTAELFTVLRVLYTFYARVKIGLGHERYI